jgi:hypothetical protein
MLCYTYDYTFDYTFENILEVNCFPSGELAKDEAFG